MKHFVYKTYREDTGEYYIGRHSTVNINDGYFGSGGWVTDCLRDDIKLFREEIKFFKQALNKFLNIIYQFYCF